MKKNVASQHIGGQVINASTGAGVTASVSVTVSGDGGAQGAGGGSLSHLGSGWWDYIPTQAETNYDFIVFQFTASGAIPTSTAVYTSVDISSNIKKNQALSGFVFTMTDSTNHNPATGLTVTAQRSIDAAAFASTSNSVSELSNGDYYIDLTATDLNGDTIMLKFTATGADDLNILVVTQP